MTPIRRRGLALAFSLACLLAMPGCEAKVVTVELPTYFSAGVDEVWFWRLDERSQGYVRSGHMKFAGLFGPPGKKILQYTMVAPDGTQGLTITSPVSIQGDSITVALNYARWANPGWFRVTARNRAGESALSAREVYL
jgi:hypothetical protein